MRGNRTKHPDQHNQYHNPSYFVQPHRYHCGVACGHVDAHATHTTSLHQPGGQKNLTVLGQTSSKSESALITSSSAITQARSSRSTRVLLGLKSASGCGMELSGRPHSEGLRPCHPALQGSMNRFVCGAGQPWVPCTTALLCVLSRFPHSSFGQGQRLPGQSHYHGSCSQTGAQTGGRTQSGSSGCLSELPRDHLRAFGAVVCELQ